MNIIAFNWHHNCTPPRRVFSPLPPPQLLPPTELPPPSPPTVPTSILPPPLLAKCGGFGFCVLVRMRFLPALVAFSSEFVSIFRLCAHSFLCNKVSPVWLSVALHCGVAAAVSAMLRAVLLLPGSLLGDLDSFLVLDEWTFDSIW